MIGGGWAEALYLDASGWWRDEEKQFHGRMEKIVGMVTVVDF